MKSPVFLTSVLLAASGLFADAIVIRGFDPDNQTPYTRSWGVPFAPAENGSFPYTASKFRGVIWPDYDPLVAAPDQHWHRTVALISPQHFISATHYPLPVGWRMAFYDQNGAVQHRTILSFQTVLNSAGQPTDLTVGTLSSPVDHRGFPVLKLPQPVDYVGKPLLVFGTTSHVGTGIIAGFKPSTVPVFANTVFSYFHYNDAAGNAGECEFNPGDSGAPTFVYENGVPLLIGSHSDNENTPGGSDNLDAFIPEYLEQIDPMISGSGYNVRRWPLEAAVLELTPPSAAGPLRQRQAGSIVLPVSNSGTGIGRNAVVRISSTTPPNAVAGNGWVATLEPAGVWVCRKGNLPITGISNLTLSWDSLPDAAVLSIESSLAHDAASAVVRNDSFALTADYYLDWASGLTDAGKRSDPDHDGLANLLEYAFGTDPGVSNGNPAHFSFPRRTDAVARGLLYQVGFSSDLSAWSADLPPGITLETGPASPPREGFEEVRILLPAEAPATGFMRVKVVLDQ